MGTRREMVATMSILRSVASRSASKRARFTRVIPVRASSASATTASKTVIASDKAPAALGPYSQAIRVGDTVYVSGCLGLDPESMMLVQGGVEAQAEQVMKNMGAVLEEAGLGFENVVKTTVLLADIADFTKVNKIYGSYFTEDPPARACFAVKELPLSALVEIEAVAYGAQK